MGEASVTHEVLLVTGMSGAGKTQALKSLEDIGYEAIDNLPLQMLEKVVGVGGEEVPAKLAIGIDVRSRAFSAQALLTVMKSWKENAALDAKLVFLEAEDEALQRRFTETRRKHPLALDRPVADGIAMEHRMLQPIRAEADLVVNTTHFNVHELKRYFHDHFGDATQGLQVFVMSFSYREGIPRDADLVIDARFLKNPHYDDQLRPLTGLDAMVGAYIQEDKAFAPFFDGMCGWLEPLLPRYQQEGKSYLTIAVGCTGGKHRSVFTTEKLAGFLDGLGYKVKAMHRDLKKYRRS